MRIPRAPGTVAIALAGVVACAWTVAAQEAEEIPLAELRDSRIEEILVTAERRETYLQDTPVAVSAFSGQDLDLQGYYGFEDLSFNIPNVQFGRTLVDSGGFTIRGVSSSAGDRATAFHVDGIYLNFNLAVEGFTFYDTQRVEVLRGPQGTLYGRNATGGSINVISNPPSPEFEAFGDIQIGTYNEVLARGVLNFPILEDRLFARFALLEHSRDGFQRNLGTTRNYDADDAETFAGRAQFLWLATDDLEVTLRYAYSQRRGVGPGQKILKPFPAAVPIGRNETSEGFLVDFYGQAHPNPRDVRDIYLDYIGRVDSWDNSLNGQIAWTLPELPLIGQSRIKVLGSWLKRKEGSRSDQDGSDATLVNTFSTRDTLFGKVTDPESPTGVRFVTLDGCDAAAYAAGATTQEAGCPFSQNPRTEIVAEAQWQSADPGPLEWIFGTFYLRSELTTNNFASTKPLPFVLEPEGIGDGLSFLQTPVFSRIARTDWSIAGFGQGSYTFGTKTATTWDDWTTTLGLRYTHDHKEATRVTPRVDVLGNVVQAQIDVDDEQSWGAVSFLARAKWDWVEDHNVYASISRGYKAGFINTGLVNPEDPFTSFPNADPETILAYELGSKNRFFEDRLQGNFSFFYYDYDDLQVSQLAGVSVITQNAAKASIWGIEAEFVAKPLDGAISPMFDPLLVVLNAGYLNATYDDFPECYLPESFTTIDCSGNHMVRAPPYTLTLITEWPFDLGAFGTLIPNLQVYASGKVFFRPSNCPNEECANPGPSSLGPEFPTFNVDSQSAYQLLDFRLTWANEAGWLTIAAFVNNLTNENVIQSQVVGSNQIGSPIQVRFNPPRTAGGRLSLSW